MTAFTPGRPGCSFRRRLETIQNVSGLVVVLLSLRLALPIDPSLSLDTFAPTPVESAASRAALRRRELIEVAYWAMLVAVGLACGFLNTLASSGSAVSLPVLVMLSIPEVAANATNRLPVMIGSLMATWSFTRQGQMDWHGAAWLLPSAVFGSVAGALLAEKLANRQMGLVITAAVLMALLLLFTKVKQALARERGQMPQVTFSAMALLFGVGFWLGFIVLDGATYLLLVLMLVCNYDLPQANALKVLLIAVTTLVPIAMFARAGDIFWSAGALMSAGSLLGGHVGARLSSHPQARAWVFWLLVAVILLELAQLVWHYTAPLRAAL
jgi:uncharacterized protein